MGLLGGEIRDGDTVRVDVGPAGDALTVGRFDVVDADPADLDDLPD
jgi:ATP-dependent Clp protease ATP-binding subunit ClpB